MRSCFGDRLYGPDLVNVAKEDERYYEAVFADAGVDPSVTLVVDDKPVILARARATGAMTALVGEGTPGVDADIVVPLLRDLPVALDRLAS